MTSNVSNLTIGRIDFSPFNRIAVGFDELFDQLLIRSHEAVSGSNYPPYNIIKYSTNQYAIELAVAGFDLKEISIGLEGNILTISGEKSNEQKDGSIYLHKGISNRSFKRTLPLGDYIEVKTAVIKNGMLTINLDRVIPDGLKPRKIAITSTSD